MKNQREIKKSVLEIIDNLCDRSGFDDWWMNLDDDIEQEIIEEMEGVLRKRLLKES